MFLLFYRISELEGLLFIVVLIVALIVVGRLNIGSRVLELIEDATKSGVDLTRDLIHSIAEFSKDQFRRDIADKVNIVGLLCVAL